MHSGINISDKIKMSTSIACRVTFKLFSIQVALVDILTTLGLTPNGIIGHSVGELGSAYADGSLTAEETVLAAYWRGKCITDAGLANGAMAAVGKTVNVIINTLLHFV